MLKSVKKVLTVIFHLLCVKEIYSKTLDISFNHEEVFGVSGPDTFDGIPTVVDKVKFSKLRWEDDEGHQGIFNFTNPGWADSYMDTSGEHLLVYDSQDFIKGHHKDDWYDTEYDQFDYEDEPSAWFDENANLKDVKPVSNKDYYDFLMQLYANEHAARNLVGTPIIVKDFDSRKKKSIGYVVKPRTYAKTTEPCTSTSLRLCNVFFAIPLITVVIIVLIIVYFCILYCYIKNPWRICTKCCPWMYKYGNKYIWTTWGDNDEVSLRIHTNKCHPENEQLMTV